MFLQTIICHSWILFRRSCYSHVSISADASFPVVPKWILMNLPLQVKKMMLLYTKPEAHKKDEIGIIIQTCFPWHLRAEKTLP